MCCSVSPRLTAWQPGSPGWPLWWRSMIDIAQLSGCVRRWKGSGLNRASVKHFWSCSALASVFKYVSKSHKRPWKIKQQLSRTICTTVCGLYLRVRRFSWIEGTLYWFHGQPLLLNKSWHTSTVIAVRPALFISHVRLFSSFPIVEHESFLHISLQLNGLGYRLVVKASTCLDGSSATGKYLL